MCSLVLQPAGDADGDLPSFSSEASRLMRRPRRLPTWDRHICTVVLVSSLKCDKLCSSAADPKPQRTFGCILLTSDCTAAVTDIITVCLMT